MPTQYFKISIAINTHPLTCKSKRLGEMLINGRVRVDRLLEDSAFVLQPFSMFPLQSFLLLFLPF